MNNTLGDILNNYLSQQSGSIAATPSPLTGYKYAAAVVLGRFQPLHDEHRGKISAALTIARKVMVVVGSADEAQSLKNPLTFEMRRGMIEAAFPAEIAAGRLIIQPLADYTYRDAVWSHKFTELCARYFPAGYIFFTYAKDAATTQYINDGLPANVKRVYYESKNPNLNATDIRNDFFSGVPCLNISGIGHDVAVRLHSYKLTEEYETFTKELAAGIAYRKAWEAAPFPPHFVAVDALVKWYDGWKKPYLLVGVRKSEFGNGKWALPGGYLEVKETLLESAKRELLEETGLAVDDGFVLRKVETFDDPNRSTRGRMITHVHEWDCYSTRKPALIAGDDFSDAFWLPFDEIAANKRNFFSDHYPIIAKLNPTVEEYL